MVCLVKNALFIVWKRGCFMYVYVSIFNILHMTMTHATKCNVLSLPQIWQLFLPCDSPDVCNVIMTRQTSFTYFSTYLYLEILAVWNVFYSVCVVCPSMGASVSRPFLKSPHWINYVLCIVEMDHKILNFIASSTVVFSLSGVLLVASKQLYAVLYGVCSST